MELFSYSFWLPFPPSANRLWRSVRGRVITSPEYKAWQLEAGDAATVQGLGRKPVLGSYRLHLELSRVFRSRGDENNRLKSVHDICKTLHLTIDDRYSEGSLVEWADVPHDCLVTLSGKVEFSSQWEWTQYLARVLSPRKDRRLDRKPRSA